MQARYALLIALLGACTGTEESDTDTGVPEPTAPTLVHVPPTSLAQGALFDVQVDATDPEGVDRVIVYWRSGGSLTWNPLFLERGAGAAWTGQLPASAVLYPQLEYYLRATDQSPLRTTSQLPADGEDAPFVVPVEVIGASLPFVEDFNDEDDIYSLGWTDYSAGWPGFAWGLLDDGDSQIAWHRRGIDGFDPVDDWLVSPAIDLRAPERIQITWREAGAYVTGANHSVWISTTSPDPSDGSFVEVAAMPAPGEGVWARSSVVDLTPYVGAQAAWIAFRYQGQFTDDWLIDDVIVEELGPDLFVSDVSWSPNPAGPGESTTLSVTVGNRTDVAADAYAVAWTVDPLLANFAASAPLTVPGLGSATATTTVAVEPTAPNNSRLPFTLALGDDDRWQFDDEMFVGLPSLAHVVLHLNATGLVRARVGTGDPAAPDAEFDVFAEVLAAGDHEADIDITDAWPFLPTGPGPARWWLEIDAAAAGDVKQFDIAYDGANVASDDLVSFDDTEVATAYLPRPASPVIATSITSPTKVAPGSAVVWTVGLRNNGAATTGATTLSLRSADPDVTVTTAGPFTIGTATGWAAGGTSSSTFGFTVSSAHTDSTPVDVELVVEDSVESFVVPVEVEVPWPVLRVVSVEVDDGKTGDDDGRLDPDESANLVIRLGNTGDLGTFGSLSCTLSTTTSAATADVDEDSGSFGLIAAGATKSENDFAVTVTSGAIGDELDLSLACKDSSTTYTVPFDLELGELPWLVLSTVDDDPEDALTGYDLDIVNGRYRSDGVTLDIELESSTDFDLAKVFVEAWGTSTGATYTYYNYVLQPGKDGPSSKLRGYERGVFTDLTKPEVTQVDTNRLRISIEVAAVGLALDKLELGFASGFCGGDPYYCDHYPDDWGDPYVKGFDTTRWVTLEW